MREPAEQAQIDISNLRFYADMAHKFHWQTDIIHFGVVEQTLTEIANRLTESEKERQQVKRQTWPCSPQGKHG